MSRFLSVLNLPTPLCETPLTLRHTVTGIKAVHIEFRDGDEWGGVLWGGGQQ